MKTASIIILVFITGFINPTSAQVQQVKIVELGNIGGENRVSAVNNVGQSVGWAKTPGNITHAVLWDKSGNLIDLHSTLKSSFNLPDAASSSAVGINNKGLVIGHYTDSSGHQRAFIYVPYTPSIVEDLGTIGGNGTQVISINENGQIIGKSEHSLSEWKPFIITPLDTNGDEWPDKWNVQANGVNALMIGLGTAPSGTQWGGQSSPDGPTALNNQGIVTGIYFQPWGETGQVMRSFGWSPQTQLLPLGTLGGTQEDSSEPEALSSTYVTGYSSINGETHAFLVKPQPCGEITSLFCDPSNPTFTMIDLGTLGGPYSIGRDVNNAGKVVGESNLNAGGALRAVLWEEGKAAQNLGTLSGNWSTASSINDADQVIGTVQSSSCPIEGPGNPEYCPHVFFWSDNTGMIDLPLPAGHTRSLPVAISNTGYIVGNVLYYTYVHPYTRSHTKAVLWAIDLMAPTLNIPDQITVDATDPSGAFVTYSVSAIDDNDPNPVINCQPSSGSFFYIGNTEVTCTAMDNSGNVASRVFMVSVKGASQQLIDLMYVTAGLNLMHGISSSLDLKLQNIQRAIEEEKLKNIAVSCRQLDAFIHEVQAQSGKGLTGEQANKIIEAATRIQMVLGCYSG